MILVRGTVGVLGAVCICLAAAGSARAWTETDVQSARAEVDVGSDGRARVVLELEVRVRGGWVEGLEVAGLDPDVQLDPKRPAWWLQVDESEDGAPPASFEPDLKVYEDGRVHFRFPRRRAPRRGTYRAGFAYETRLQARALDDDRVRLGWTLPPWRSGLDDVTVTLHAPEGARPAVEPPDAPSAVQASRSEKGDRTTIRFRRAHLPRTVAWTVGVTVPSRAVDLALRPEPSVAPPRTAGSTPTPTGTSGALPWLVAAALMLLVAAKLWLYGRACREARVRPRPLVPLPPWLRTALSAAAALGAAAAWAHLPAAALALVGAVPLLAMERLPRPPAPPRLGAFRRVRREDLRLARRRAWWHRGLALAPGAGLLPTSPALRLRRLERVARELRFELDCAVPMALELAVHEDQAGHWQDARLSCVLPRAPSGLLRLHVSVADRPEAGHLRCEPVLVVVTRRASMADTLLDDVATWDERIEAPGARVARVVRLGPSPGDTLMRTARTLTAWSVAEPVDRVNVSAVA
ncbi:MAG: hypothetical protein ACOCV4_08970 [Myxococcota bacterium]